MPNITPEREKSVCLTKGLIGRLILKLSAPCVLSILVSALDNIVDQIFIGRSVGYFGNAATNVVVYPFTVVALTLALLAGDGAAALLSLSLGRVGRDARHKCVGNAILLTAGIGVILMLAGLCLTDAILSFFGVTEASCAYVRDYIEVILLGIPFYTFAAGMNALLRADGAPGYAMCATVFCAVTNLILGPVASFLLHRGYKAP